MGNWTASTENRSVSCPPLLNADFESLDTIVPYVVNIALNVSLAIVGTLMNVSVFLAISRSKSIRLPSKLLLCTLITTDLGNSLVVQPQFIVTLIMKANKDAHNINCFHVKFTVCLGSLFCCASLLTMTAICLDRYTALFYHLKYLQQIVTVRRVLVVLSFIWSFAVFYASTFFWSVDLWYILSVLTWTAICPIVISVAYTKIHRELRRRHDVRVQDQGQAQDQAQQRQQQQQQQQQGNTLNLAKYRKSTSAMFWVYALFTLCYLPDFLGNISLIFFPYTALSSCILEFLFTIVFLNSCLNPFVYCMRLSEIRAEVFKQLRKLFCQCP